jgi:hypothetical protein
MLRQPGKQNSRKNAQTAQNIFLFAFFVIFCGYLSAAVKPVINFLKNVAARFGHRAIT